MITDPAPMEAHAIGALVGDDAAFDRWIAPEIDFVKRVSRRFCVSRADAEDLVQEVLAKAYKGIRGFDGRYPRAWLHRIILNTAASRARKRRIVEVSLNPEADSPSMLRYQTLTGSTDPEAIVLSDVLDPLLAGALEALPEHHRNVIDLVDVRSMTYEEAAEALGVPVGTIMSRLHRARGRLRDSLAGSHLERATHASAVAPI